MRRLAQAGTLICLTGLAWTSSGAAHAARTPQQAQMETIVRTWTKRLNARDNKGIARLFTVPATVIQPPYEYRFKTRAQIAEWHSALPCSGRIVGISFRRNTTTATFRLGNRGTTPCDGPGTLAAARFTIVKGLITVWEQVPVPKTSSTTA
jgi:hypothetical protein